MEIGQSAAGHRERPGGNFRRRRPPGLLPADLRCQPGIVPGGSSKYLFHFSLHYVRGESRCQMSPVMGSRKDDRILGLLSCWWPFFPGNFPGRLLLMRSYAPDWPKYFWVAGFILVRLEPATDYSRDDYPSGHNMVGLGPDFWAWARPFAGHVVFSLGWRKILSWDLAVGVVGGSGGWPCGLLGIS